MKKIAMLLPVKPVYIEPDVIVSPFRLTARECK